MRTSSIWTFADIEYTPAKELHVFKLWDGYPQGAVVFVVRSFFFLHGPLPRLKAGELAAAFVAANRPEGGDILLSHSRHDVPDVAFGYTLWSESNGTPMIRAVRTNYRKEPKEEEWIFEGRLTSFLEDFAFDEDGKSLVDKDQLKDVVDRLRAINR